MAIPNSKQRATIPAAHRALALAVLLLSGLGVWRLSVLVQEQTFDRISRTGESRIALYTTSLRDTLEKYRPIPYLLARDTRVHELLHGKMTALRVNPHLEDYGRSAGALIFIMDSTGNTVASSNWRATDSLMGNNFSFRPYFQDAREGLSGGYFAVGLKTRKPGFFISYPVLDTGRLLGVVVVKVDLEELQNSWRESGETIIVSDAFGVLFLSSRPDWKYRSLRPLPEKAATRLRTIQYLQQPLTALDLRRQATERGNIVHIENRTYLEQSRQMLAYGWRLHYLSDLAPVTTNSRLATAIGAGIATTALLVFLFFRERRQKLISRREAREARAIKELNQRLTREIAEHRATEQTLRRTQKELLQVEKLAALGRMSAAIAHELNQPVTAIRTFLASSRIFLDRRQNDKIAENLDFIDRLTERMAIITGQLKTFARKQKGGREPVDLSQVSDDVLGMMTPLLKTHEITIEKDFPPPGTAVVDGDRLQIEQVLTNLIHNAIDAMINCEGKLLRLDITQSATTIRLSCADNGPGIAEEAFDALFEPFFTTKECGQGLGLGLAIVYGIVREMGGSISATNRTGGGAIFHLDLPRSPVDILPANERDRQ